MGADSRSVEYPVYIIPEDEQLANTHFGRFGDDDNLDMYAWPLLWTNSYTGKYKLFCSFYVSSKRITERQADNK